MIRALRIESRRGAAVLVLLCLAAEALMLSLYTGSWGARWMGVGLSFRETLTVLLPLVAAGAAWHASRDHRHGLTELLTSVPRPPWQQVTVAWTAVTLGALAGVVVPLLVVMALVAPRATYAGGGWWALIATGLLSIGAAAAAGVLVGKRWPSRVIAPLAGVAVVVVLEAARALDNMAAVRGTWSAQWLNPVVLTPQDGYRLDSGTHLQQVTWFAALTAVFLVLAGARRRLLAVAPLAVAVAVAVPLADPRGDERWSPDSRALEATCRTDDEVRVCLTRLHAFALEQVASTARPAISRLTQATGASVTVTDLDDPPPGWLHAYVGGVDWKGRMRHPSELWYWVGASLGPACPTGTLDDAQWVHFGEVAAAWALGESTVDSSGVASVAEEDTVASQVLLDRLRSRPEDVQRAWIAQYMAARSRCDGPTAQKLLQP